MRTRVHHRILLQRLKLVMPNSFPKYERRIQHLLVFEPSLAVYNNLTANQRNIGFHGTITKSNMSSIIPKSTYTQFTCI